MRTTHTNSIAFTVKYSCIYAVFKTYTTYCSTGYKTYNGVLLYLWIISNLCLSLIIVI